MNQTVADILFVVYALICVCLIVAVASQTSKSEQGLSGVLGGKTEAAPFLRKKTWDEQLNRITGFLAWSFLILSTAIVLLRY